MIRITQKNNTLSLLNCGHVNFKRNRNDEFSKNKNNNGNVWPAEYGRRESVLWGRKVGNGRETRVERKKNRNRRGAPACAYSAPDEKTVRKNAPGREEEPLCSPPPGLVVVLPTRPAHASRARARAPNTHTHTDRHNTVHARTCSPHTVTQTNTHTHDRRWRSCEAAAKANGGTPRTVRYVGGDELSNIITSLTTY